MYYIVGVEVLQNGNHHRAVGQRGDICHAPARIVASQNRHLVSGLYAGLLEQQMQFGYLLGHREVRKLLSLEIIRKSGQFAILAETALVHPYKILL